MRSFHMQSERGRWIKRILLGVIAGLFSCVSLSAVMTYVYYRGLLDWEQAEIAAECILGLSVFFSAWIAGRGEERSILSALLSAGIVTLLYAAAGTFLNGKPVFRPLPLGIAAIAALLGSACHRRSALR